MRELGGVAEYEYGKALRLTEQGMKTLEIPSFSIVEQIRERDDVYLLYYREDGHFNEKGNELVAELILDHLMTSYFSEKDPAFASTGRPEPVAP
jgi:hypothetical protein